ncbi:hypothetical protein CH63R_11544 [Colletotrichum higginsianum IMI 349063]|uniref:Uncharacterized protein n=2 Tax=Colletotrichum higginsianum TaxID=80884 RepID=A0A1B7XYN4_COLHI|nr:hypothetical protein CH63R_11544 [Colletotrichum higginsianum IMI 349063]OBR04841.1 hypothetical protein CH63R_11544 [Colletotrichum higginsianum IMI 349063]
MAFTFWAYARHPVLTTELWAKGPGGSIKKVVPRIDLGVWLTYAPHFVRIHEELGLALYEHPFRFTWNHYEKDQAHFHDSSVVPFREIDEGEILELIDGMGINLGDFEQVIPSSWPGSRLQYPGLPGMAPTLQNQRSLAMPDVHLLGHPGYQVNTMPGPGKHKSTQHQRRVLVPKRLIPLYMVVSKVTVAQGTVTSAGAEALVLYKKELIYRYGQQQETPLLLTAPKLVVKRPFQTLQVSAGQLDSDAILFPDSDPHRMFRAYRNQRFPFEALIDPAMLDDIINCHQRRLQIARERGIRTDQLAVSINGLLTWTGSHFDELFEVADSVAPMVRSHYIEAMEQRIQLATRTNVLLSTLLVGYDSMLSWDSISNNLVSHRQSENTLNQPQGYRQRIDALGAIARREKERQEDLEQNVESAFLRQVADSVRLPLASVTNDQGNQHRADAPTQARPDAATPAAQSQPRPDSDGDVVMTENENLMESKAWAKAVQRLEQMRPASATVPPADLKLERRSLTVDANVKLERCSPTVDAEREEQGRRDQAVQKSPNQLNPRPIKTEQTDSNQLQDQQDPTTQRPVIEDQSLQVDSTRLDPRPQRTLQRSQVIAGADGIGFGAHRNWSTRQVTDWELNLFVVVIRPISKGPTGKSGLRKIIQLWDDLDRVERFNAVELGKRIGLYLGNRAQHTKKLREYQAQDDSELDLLLKPLTALLGISGIDPTRPVGQRDLVTNDDHIRVITTFNYSLGGQCRRILAIKGQPPHRDELNNLLSEVKAYPWGLYLNKLTLLMNHLLDVDIDDRRWYEVFGTNYSEFLERNKNNWV